MGKTSRGEMSKGWKVYKNLDPLSTNSRYKRPCRLFAIVSTLHGAVSDGTSRTWPWHWELHWQILSAISNATDRTQVYGRATVTNAPGVKLAVTCGWSTLCPKKVSPLMFDNNFGKCEPIFKILSPIDSYEKSLCRPIHHKYFHLTCSMLLHYLVKLKIQKCYGIFTLNVTFNMHN